MGSTPIRSRHPDGTPRNAGMGDSWVGEDRARELATRRRVLRRAKEGDEDSLAHLRDEYGIQTLTLDGRPLIREGVLVGAKVSQ